MNMSLVLDTPRTQSWRTTLPALVLWLALTGALFYDTFAAMVGIWYRSETFAHAFAVPPLVLWMVWRRRAVLAPMVPVAWPIALLPFALAALGWLAGRLVAANAVMQLSATAMLVLAVPALVGWQVTRVILFPLVYLFFAVPIGEFMIPPLMQWTADFTVWALRLSGIPVYREGLQFVIPSGNWSVVEACSGVRYLMASFMVGTLFGYLNYQSWQRRWIFAGVSLAVPILANWLRAYMIVMLGHLSGNKLAVGADHLVYGWVFFGIVITLLFMIGARWAEPEAAAAPEATGAAGTGPFRAHGGLVVLAIGVLLAAAPRLWLSRLDAAVSQAPVRLALPSTAADWTRIDQVPEFRPRYIEPSAQAEAIYQHSAGDGPVGVYLAYYRGQTEQRKLVSSENVIVTSKDALWHAVDVNTVGLPGSGVAVRQTRLQAHTAQGGGERAAMLVWQIYWVNGEFVHEDYRAKLLGAWQRLRGMGDESAAIVLYAPERPGHSARPALDRFIAANQDSLRRALDQARDGRP